MGSVFLVPCRETFNLHTTLFNVRYTVYKIVPFLLFHYQALPPIDLGLQTLWKGIVLPP